MAKSSNPVDAHRKAQRAKELKKNKQNRSKVREISTVKKDTRPLEQEIRQLSGKGNLSKQDKDQLASLRAEVARIDQAKSEYVEAHPEHRKFVFPERPSDQSEGAGQGDEPKGLYDKNGRLKHPERSVYFDPVFNPFGAPPPGMPYREKPEFALQRLGIPTPEEMAAFNPVVPEGSDDEEEEEDSDEDDIEMPAGPPPKNGESEDSDSSDDDDDIPLPPGPPPPKVAEPVATSSSRVHITRPSQPRPRAQPHPPHPHALPSRPAFLPPPPNAPTGPRNPHHLPSRPPPPSQHMSDPMSLGESGPQRAYQQGSGPIGPQFPAGPPPSQSSSATISAGPSPFLPIGAPSASASASSSSATISAAPQLRDLKKEATAFLPAAMRKKQQAAKAKLDRVGLSKVDAARTGTEGEETGGEQEQGFERGPSLMESLKAKGVGAGGGLGGSLPPPKGKKGDEDYRKFEEDMAEFL
ncbi:uncharacterized protein JCM6883_000580 [Sporobolomyces salmoneus]|uniref:uncharacterized protein n=1 Tax=Sporobolomyces salmoneus TaxID=183962 RepID=UPI00316EDF4A